MFGKDFFVYWQIGRAVLDGIAPYSVPESLYPPATIAFFIVLSLPPFTLAYALWTGANVALLLQSIRSLSFQKVRLLWFVYPPILFVLLTGQMDLILLWASTLLPLGGFQASLAAAILTLKPQAAFIILPWYIIRWIRSDRTTLLKAFSLVVVLHTIPLVINPTIYADWIISVQAQSAWRLSSSPGLFALTTFNIPVLLLMPLAIIVATWGLLKSSQTSFAAQLFVLPMGLWYESVFLVGVAPLVILIPIGIVSFILAAVIHSSWPLAALPFAALCWRFSQEHIVERSASHTNMNHPGT